MLALVLAGASAVQADTITLRTGERVVGEVVSETQDKVVFKSQGLGRIEILRENIERIQREPAPEKPGPPPKPKAFQPEPPAAVKPPVSPAPSTNAPAAQLASTNAPSWFRRLWQSKNQPDDESVDWIQLKSGEWLRGRLDGMQNRTVEFESDELDDLTFDWKDVHQVQMPRALVSYGERQTVGGAVKIDREKVTVAGAEPLEFSREDLIGIAPGQRREIDYWSGKFNVGLNIRAGNTEQVDLVTKAKLERRTPNTHLELDYTGNFSEVADVETVNNQRLNGTFNVFLTRRLFLVTPLAEFYSDPFQNIAGQMTLGGGGGYYLVDAPKVEWLVQGGPAYQRTRFETVQAGEETESTTPALFLQSSLDLQLTKRIDLELATQAIYSSEEAGRATYHSTATLEIDLTRRLDLDVALVWDRTKSPRPDGNGVVPKQDDFRLNLSLGVKF